MTDRSRGAVITISTPGTPPPPAQNIVTYPLVRRRVRHLDGLDVQGHVYACGAVVTLPSDRAFALEHSGHLHRGDPS